MKIEEIILKLNNITENNSNYTLINIDSLTTKYFGKNKDGDIVFVSISKMIKAAPSHYKTSKLALYLNVNCEYLLDGHSRESISNILECKSTDLRDIEAFIRLCKTLIYEDIENQTLIDLFNSLKNLFNVSTINDIKTMNGLFGELYTIYYLKQQKIDISRSWQRKDMMKFDFMLDNLKRIDVKTTTSTKREHKFKHEQLQYEDYDIVIVSIMLRESNTGISLYDVINFAREIYQLDFKRLSIIEKKIHNFSDEELKEKIFDKPYLENNIKFIPAEEIPRFKEKNPEKIRNAEYSANLVDSACLTLPELHVWINEQ